PSAAHLSVGSSDLVRLGEADRWKERDPLCVTDARGRHWDLAELKPGTTLVGASVRRAHWAGVDLRGVRMKDGDLTGADLSGSRWRGGNLELVAFDAADLRGADLSGVTLIDITAAGADLRGADFRGMSFVDDSGVQMLRLLGATYDASTRWPAGFDH